jgi:MinD superfamily P-loop ATPase
MKEIVVISGKGGTGKTSIAACFGHLASNHVLADCDVDAADLHILAHPEKKEQEEFLGGAKAVIDPKKCSECGECVEACRYDAITEEFKVDHVSCEGCGLCYQICPEKAISLDPMVCGNWYISQSLFGPMVHADLFPGEENSGKLVALVRNQAKVLAKKLDKSLIITDGAPGVGCPVIASVTGAHRVIVVTEPSLSGIHDMERVLELVKGFNIDAGVIINKHDVHEENSRAIDAACSETGAPLLGKIPYDKSVILSMVQGRPVTQNGDSPAGESIRKIWDRIEKDLD